MKIQLAIRAIIAMLLSVSMQSSAANQTIFPPLMFISTIDGGEMYEKIKQHVAFEKLDKEGIGNPIKLFISHRLEATAGGTAAGLTSAMLAGGSLGLLPVVTNNDLVLTYDLRVHNQSIAKFTFRENFTDAVNIYQNQGMGSLDEDAIAWAVSTVDQFTDQIVNNKDVLGLLEEYDYYFGQDAEPASE